jgi:hypothetical protein
MDDLKSANWNDSKSLARAILSNRAERRKWIGRLLLIPLCMIGIGLWVIDDWVWGSLWRSFFWWGGCLFATVVVILFALYDALIVFREERFQSRSKPL